MIRCIDCKYGSFAKTGTGPYNSRKKKYVGRCTHNDKPTTQNCYCELFTDRD